MNPYKTELDQIKAEIKKILLRWDDRRKDKKTYLDLLKDSDDNSDLIESTDNLLEIYEYEIVHVGQCKIQLELFLEILQKINNLFTATETINKKWTDNLKLVTNSLMFFVGRGNDVSYLLKLMNWRLKVKIISLIENLSKLETSIRLQVDPTKHLQILLKNGTIQSSPVKTRYYAAIYRNELLQKGIIENMNKTNWNRIKKITTIILSRMGKTKLQLTGTSISTAPLIIGSEFGLYFFFAGLLLSWSSTINKWRKERDYNKKEEIDKQKRLELEPYQ